MTFTAALAFAVLTLIAREDPTMRDRAPETFAAFQQSVGKLVPLHIETAKPGHLVSPEMDALILASVNYAETRFRLPAPKGDCYRTHRYRGVPSMRWPKGYVPKMQWVCPAVGPMNIAQGNRPYCVSDSGAVDMMGSAEEWVKTSDGYALAGRFWAEPWACYSMSHRHAPDWHYYQSGFRCCLDL